MKHPSFNHGIDVRDIPIENFPTPPNEFYKWEFDANHLHLIVPDEDYMCVTYDIPGGYIISHAEIEIVEFFMESIRSVTKEWMARQAGQQTDVSEESTV